jgi:hypothetical protein
MSKEKKYDNSIVWFTILTVVVMTGLVFLVSNILNG